MVRTENPKDILERFGPDKKDPKDVLARLWGGQRTEGYPRKIWCGQKIQKISSKDLGWTKRSKRCPSKIVGWTKDPKLIRVSRGR